MRIPGFSAELSLGKPTQDFRTIEGRRGSAHLGVSPAAAHEHPPLKRVLDPLPPHTHTCEGVHDCLELGQSGLCSGVDVVCSGSVCACAHN
jgi:hypothetical protein